MTNTQQERRDTAGRVLDRIWWSITTETRNDLGELFDYPRAAHRYRGNVVAYYGGSSGTEHSARLHASMALTDRLAQLAR